MRIRYYPTKDYLWLDFVVMRIELQIIFGVCGRFSPDVSVTRTRGAEIDGRLQVLCGPINHQLAVTPLCQRLWPVT